MKALVHRLLRMRVRPYYIYQCDLITGSAHLRADLRDGSEIIRGLRGHTTGYAVPQLVIDAPGGGGKVPINPDYVESINDEEIVFRNYEGRLYRYPLKGGRPVPNEAPAGPPRVTALAVVSVEPSGTTVPWFLRRGGSRSRLKTVRVTTLHTAYCSVFILDAAAE